MEPRETIPSEIVWRGDAEEIVLFDSRTRRYHTLSRTGSEIWRLLAKGAATSKIIESLALEYAVPQDMVKEQVLAFLADVRRAGLLASSPEDV